MSALDELRAIDWSEQSFLETCIINAEDEEAAAKLAELRADNSTLRALLKEINSENELAHLENAWSWSFSSPLQGRIDAALKDPK